MVKEKIDLDDWKKDLLKALDISNKTWQIIADNVFFFNSSLSEILEQLHWKSKYKIHDYEDDNNFVIRTLKIWNETFNIEINDNFKISCDSINSWITIKDLNKTNNKFTSKLEVFNEFMINLEKWLFDSQLDEFLQK